MQGAVEEEEKKIGESAMLDQKKADSVEATEVVAESDVAQQVKHVTDRVRGGAYQWWRLIQLEIHLEDIGVELRETRHKSCRGMPVMLRL